MNRLLVPLAAGALAGALAACSADHGVTGPRPDAPATAAASAAKGASDAAALAPLADALDRVGPALGSSADAAQARTLLASLVDQARAGKTARLAGTPPVRNLAAALDRLDAADPGLAAETDAVRIALAPLR